MLVRTVIDFSNSLLKAATLPYDRKCAEDLQSTFLGRQRDTDLNISEYDDLLRQFQERWKLIKDSNDDYTRTTTETNQIKHLWINLAKELAPFVNRHHMVILTGALNTQDFNDSSPFRDEDAAEHFYLGFDTRILYRKTALRDHLISEKYVLSTNKSSKPHDLRGVTVEELVRLRACTASIVGENESERFLDFGDFLQQKVFPKLNKDNELPLEIMPYFLLLLERYFILKDSSERFSQFKVELSAFLTLLYENELSYLNQFYGIRIQINDDTQYLVNFLMSAYNAQDYELDHDFYALLKGLYQLNPSLRINTIQLVPVYASITSNQASPIATDAAQVELNECKLLLLSLFTVKFNFTRFERKRTISIFDQEREVFSEAFDFYQSLETAIKTKNLVNLLVAYRMVMNQICIYKSNSAGFFVAASSSQFWYEHVKNHTLTSLGVRWYDPKLLIHALIRFPTNNIEVARLIQSFLDELIRTYCQNRSKLEQQMRINILFSDLVCEHGKSKEFQALLLLLDIYAMEDYKSDFISNCDYYIGSRLHQIEMEASINNTTYFFSGSRKIHAFKSKNSYTDIVSVSALVDIYENEITEKKVISEEIEKEIVEELVSSELIRAWQGERRINVRSLIEVYENKIKAKKEKNEFIGKEVIKPQLANEMFKVLHNHIELIKKQLEHIKFVSDPFLTCAEELRIENSLPDRDSLGAST